jgi:uncharacterized protein YdhG (YjbR/CyaY superfamily)
MRTPFAPTAAGHGRNRWPAVRNIRDHHLPDSHPSREEYKTKEESSKIPASLHTSRGTAYVGRVPASEIDAYLATVSEPGRSTLEEMRRRILHVIPNAEQTLSYKVPAFKVDGKVVAGFAAFKNHLSYLPHSGSVLAALSDETRDYDQTKSALHFAMDVPLPQPLINLLIATKVRDLGLD